MLMKICITNTVVEFEPSAKSFKEKLYIGGGVLKLGVPLLIILHNVYLQTWPIQRNHRSPSAQITWITTISTRD